MAELKKTKKGFLIIKMSLQEARTLNWGVKEGCICAKCNNIIKGPIYYICVLGDTMCETCYNEWYNNATYYEEDKSYEAELAEIVTKKIPVKEVDEFSEDTPSNSNSNSNSKSRAISFNDFAKVEAINFVGMKDDFPEDYETMLKILELLKGRPNLNIHNVITIIASISLLCSSVECAALGQVISENTTDLLKQLEMQSRIQEN